MNTKNSKILGIMALLAVLIVGVVLISGCIKEPEKQAPVTPKPNVTTPPGEQPTERPQAVPKPNVTAPPGEQPPKRPPTEQPVTDETLREILGRGAGISSVKYDMVITVPGKPTITQKVWEKGNKSKIEMTMEGQTMILLIDEGTKIAYQYFPEFNVAMKIGFKEPESPIEAIKKVEKHTPVVIGTEIVDGKRCIIIEYFVEGIKTKIWIWKEKGFPVRTEVITSEGKMITEYKNIDFADIPDSVFELPAGVQIAEMPIGGMPPGMLDMYQEENITE